MGEKLVNISTAEITDVHEVKSADSKTDAALTFPETMVVKMGYVSEQDVDVLKVAGYDEGAIAEIIFHPGLNILTNYFNNTAQVAVDFPLVPMAAAI